MRANIVWGVSAGVMLLGAGWLLGRHSAPSLARPAEGVKVVAAQAVAPAPARENRRADAPVAPMTPAASATGAATHIPEDRDVQGTLFELALQPEALYRRIRAEPIDAAANAPMQRAIDAGLVKVPYLDRDKLRVRCATTLCEIHGGFAAGASMDNVNVAMQELQGGALADRLHAAGLEIALASFGRDGFTIYTKPR